jgi:type III secretion protein C
MVVNGGVLLSFLPFFFSCLAMFASMIGASRAAEPEWATAPYKYMIVDQDLRDVLAEFGRNVNLPTNISKDVAGRRIRGDFTALPAREYLQRLCDDYGLVWYFDGAVLHINSENEIRTELINVSPVEPASLLQDISALGIRDSRYEIRASRDAGVIAVSGPPPFLSLVRKTVSALQAANAPVSVRENADAGVVNVRVFRGGRQGS